MNFDIEKDDIIDIYDELYIVEDNQKFGNKEEVAEEKIAEVSLDSFLVLGKLDGKVKVLLDGGEFKMNTPEYEFLTKVLSAVKKDITNCSVYVEGQKVIKAFGSHFLKDDSINLCFGLPLPDGQKDGEFETIRTKVSRTSYYPSLRLIMSEEPLKRKLWNSLKVVFNLST